MFLSNLLLVGWLVGTWLKWINTTFVIIKL